MRKDGLIIRTTENDRSMMVWLNAQEQKPGTKKMMDLTSDNMRLLLAGNKLISNDAIFRILKETGRLYSDRCLLTIGFNVRKRSLEQIQALFAVSDESAYQEFVFYCQRRIYFLSLCRKILDRLGSILKVYNFNDPLFATEWNLLESVPSIQDLCAEGIKNAKDLITEYHTYHLSFNDLWRNVRIPIAKEISFRDSVMYHFSLLNQSDQGNYDSIDYPIEDFFRTVLSCKTKEGCMKDVLAGKSIPHSTNVLPLNKAEINFIRAFAFLD